MLHCRSAHQAGLQFRCGLCQSTFGKPMILANHLQRLHTAQPPPENAPRSSESHAPQPDRSHLRSHSPRESLDSAPVCMPTLPPRIFVTLSGSDPAQDIVSLDASASPSPHALPEAQTSRETGVVSTSEHHARQSVPPPPSPASEPRANSDITDSSSDEEESPSAIQPGSASSGRITTKPSTAELSEAFVNSWLPKVEFALESGDKDMFFILISTISSDWLNTARQVERQTYRGKRNLRRAPSLRYYRGGDDGTNDQQRYLTAGALRSMFRMSPAKAVRAVLQPPPTNFTGDIGECRAHWESEGQAREVNEDQLLSLLDCLPPPPSLRPNLTAPLTPEEVGRRLHRATNTSPGSDRLEYRHLRALDPDAQLITPILNGCLQLKCVPDDWKTGVTILIHKKGDAADPGNFRPITLLPTLYKLLAGCLSARLSKWAKDNTILSPQQKGFVPGVEGCLEQSFLVGSAFEESRDVGLHRGGLPVFSAFLDLQNAFGSVPHASLLRVLRRVGVDDDFCAFVDFLYTNSTVALRVNGNNCEPFLTTAGVRQGDPLSPILFDLAMEPVVRRAARRPERGFPIGEARLTVCALADDLALFADSESHLQWRVRAAGKAASTIGLRFRPEKCAIIARCANEDIHASIRLQGAVIPSVPKDQSVLYLGAPQGLCHPRAEYEQATNSLIRDMNLIRVCSLAPWQKLDVLRTFLLPRLDYLCRAKFSPKKELLKDADDTLIKFCKSVCGFDICKPTSHIFFSHRAFGGLGFVRLARNAQILHATQACRMLCVTDPTIAIVARHRLVSAVDRAKGDSASDAGLTRYLGGDGFFAKESRLHTFTQKSKYTSFWADARQCLLDLGTRLNIIDGKVQTLTHSTAAEKPIKRRRTGVEPMSRPEVESDFIPRLVTQKLRQLSRDTETAEWTALKLQGGVAKCLAYDPYATHSRFYWTGTGLSFRQWRFAFRARLNLLHTRLQLARFARSSKRGPVAGSTSCRVCGAADESALHVLNKCDNLLGVYKVRHDAIVQRIADALPASTAKRLLDKRPVKGINQRPDISVWRHNGDVVLVDVTCPYESNENALDDAFQVKVQRYSNLARTMATGSVRSAVVRPFVVGSLGGWHPGNEQCLEDLGISRHRRKLLRQLCVADAIAGSEAIWSRVENGITDRRTTGQPAVPPPPDAGPRPVALNDVAQQTSSTC